MKKDSINIVTLGCSKNVVDTEVLMNLLKTSGFEVEHNSDSIKHKTVVINTCGFIGDAKEESVNTIVEMADHKTRGNIKKIVVFGCLSQRYPEELRKELPEVDAFFGVDDTKELTEYLGAVYDPELVTTREITTPSHYAFLKISEGCNWGCSYCAIPLIRGRHKSRPIEGLITEAKALAAKGVKELILIAQDLTFYGKDLYGERRLAELLNLLCEIEGIEWIRLHYTYPTAFPREVIEVMKNQSKICKYIDIPFQHVNSRILTSMKRGINKEQTEDLMSFFRSEIPEIAIRTTMIVGYPGETEAEFEELVEFVKKSRFDRLGVFAYSEEEDTYAATLPDDVPDAIKQQRLEHIMTVQEEIALQNNNKYVGTTQRVIIDRCE
ncbi:MAG: 30S ribosomal protein S12 methylthiotransferase RimO, partial [Rikenellaceae bacterium]